MGPTKSGPYTQVVFMRRFNNIESISLGICLKWSLYTGGLYGRCDCTSLNAQIWGNAWCRLQDCQDIDGDRSTHIDQLFVKSQATTARELQTLTSGIKNDINLQK